MSSCRRRRWPIVTAFGLTLFLAAFVTDITFAIAGIIAVLPEGSDGAWTFFRILSTSRCRCVQREHPEPIRTAGRVVRILDVGKTHRARIPVEVHPYTAGAFGGLVGAVVMAVLACLYGIFKYGSIWYPSTFWQPPGFRSSRRRAGGAAAIQLHGPGCRHPRSHFDFDSRWPSLCGASADVAGTI